MSTKSKETRIKVLTEKGFESYETRQNRFKRRIKYYEEEIADICKSTQKTQPLGTLLEIKDKLTQIYGGYDSICNEYLDFLKRTNTEESNKEAESFAHEIDTVCQLISRTYSDIEFCFQIQEKSHDSEKSQAPSSKQHSSTKSNTSVQSSLRSVLAKKRAEAKAASVRAEYIKQETDLLKQKSLLAEKQAIESANANRHAADIDAELNLLTFKKEAAAVNAEVDVLSQEVAAGDGSQILSTVNSGDEVPKYFNESKPMTTNEKVSKYLLDQAEQNNLKTFDVVDQVKIEELPTNREPENKHLDFTKFLLKKDLMFSRFTTFNDKPELYPSWKNTFKNIIKDIQADESEEMDLLLKYTGSQSQKHVQSIRTSNSSDPVKGLKLIWSRLDERYGSPELIDHALKSRLHSFPKLINKDNKMLYDLADILCEIQSLKSDAAYGTMFSYFDSSIGINPIVQKLPDQLREKWTSTAVAYNRKHETTYPPFHVFVDYIHEQAKVRNNPSFVYEDQSDSLTSKRLERNTSTGYPKPNKDVRSKKTELSENTDVKVSEPCDMCPIHNAKHSLNNCKTFKRRPLFERRRFLRQHKICFKCCASVKHMYNNCPNQVKCDDCGSNGHPTAMHIKLNALPKNNDSDITPQNYGGERTFDNVNSKCTMTNEKTFNGKSCAKIVLVKLFTEDQPDNILHTYAMIDDQSNRTLAKTAVFDHFGATGLINYKLSTCTGETQATGRVLNNLIIESDDGSTQLKLPAILECDQIPVNIDEIPTKEVAESYWYMKDIVDFIPPLNEQLGIVLLIGRDLIEAHHVLDDRIERNNDERTPTGPYATKLPLGWTIIGNTCLGTVHRPTTATVRKTHLVKENRLTLFEPCSSLIHVRDNDKIGAGVFEITADDNKPGLSKEDRDFLNIMNTEMCKDGTQWSAPLPFRSNRPKLVNNKSQAMKRAKSLETSFRKNPEKKEHFFSFMKDIFDNGHAELAPPMNDTEEQWFLPIFGIYHPKKPNKIRAVFDSSAKFDGVSLNDVLLTGPDMTNNLIGILLRFRMDEIAVMADIQQMFYCFRVHEQHRKFLQFLWYEDNDFNKPLQVYRMCVHVFGNSPSPAIATYGLRKTAQNSEDQYGHDVTQFVDKNFYVDDGLLSVPTPTIAIDLMKRTKEALMQEGNIRLHKISSNSAEVMSAFPAEELAKGLEIIDFSADQYPVQRGLGMNWDLETDCFIFKDDIATKPYTRRGMLSVVNSIFDPLGVLAPVVVSGKVLLRSIINSSADISNSWDEPLPPDRFGEWDRWRASLRYIETVRLPRMCLPASLAECGERTVHIFCDASEKAIAAVGYLHTVLEGQQSMGFILGKAKVAPTHGHTIPRLELCAAVLASEIGQLISEQLDISSKSITYYSDSRVVLGYVHNTTRRFYTYVSNRVAKIHLLTTPEQWVYIHTDSNPADIGTRSLKSEDLQNSVWLKGPENLLKQELSCDPAFELQDPDTDKEVRASITSLKSSVSATTFGSHRFERFSEWKSLIRAISLLQRLGQNKNDKVDTNLVDLFYKAERFVIKVVQEEVYSDELACLKTGKALSKSSTLSTLDPFIDSFGLLRVGGRLKNADIDCNERNPIIIPSQHWIATLLVRYYHNNIKHQGRHFTSGAIRSAGYWIVGEKRLVGSILHKCVVCRKLRRPVEQQKMADLPKDRLEPGPPFSSVGIDTFGPWSVVTRRTRGGAANSKRWAIMFTCMSTRGVHLEVVENMTSSSFINAFKRFVAIRGNVKQIRSDRGTNFVGAIDALKINAINVEDDPLKEYLYDTGVKWYFNSPHSSHMGGSWERMIGTTRRILDSMVSEVPGRELTHEVLVTFLAECSAIINSRPLSAISTDPEEPYPLTPSLLLTQKPDVLIPEDVSYDCKDMYRDQWKRVQHLADVFWRRWKMEFLQNLQARRKWKDNKQNIIEGDIVLLKDNQVHRIDWAMGIIVKVFPSSDGIVRKAEVCIVRRDIQKKTMRKVTFVRPVTELVLLMQKSDM